MTWKCINLKIRHISIKLDFSLESLKLWFNRDNKDMGGVGGREETEGVYK